MPTILAGVALAISYQSKLAPAWTWTMSLKESPLDPYALSLCLYVSKVLDSSHGRVLTPGECLLLS